MNVVDVVDIVDVVTVVFVEVRATNAGTETRHE